MIIPEKLTSVERALVAASKMDAPDARRVLMLICESGMTLEKQAPQEPTEGEKHFAKREKFIQRMDATCKRVIKYAKHETLRKIEKHFRDNPTPISAAESGGAPTEPRASLAARLAFDKELFASELLAALREDQEKALGTAGQQLFDEIGKDAVWRLPSQDALKFIDVRANLLANVPDEIHREIMQSIEQGLQGGESRRQLMARISTAFDEIGKSRAETIANTETAAAFNYSRDKAMREAGVTHKRWLHSMSPLIKEPRPTHLEADGQTQAIDDPFDVGGVLFMRPADDSLGAGPEDIINCHCVSIAVEAPIESGDKPGHEFHGNQWTARGSVSEYNKKRIKEAMEPFEEKGLVAPVPVSFEQMYAGENNQATYSPERTLKIKGGGELHLKPTIKLGNRMEGGVHTIQHEYGHHIDKVLGGDAYHSMSGKHLLPHMDDYNVREQFADDVARHVRLGDTKDWGQYRPHFPPLSKEQHAAYFDWFDKQMAFAKEKFKE